jgi:uroporphyrinogen-III synthase
MNKDQPLKGYRVLVTRGKKQAAKFMNLIAANGGVPHAIPLIDFIPVANAGHVEKQLNSLEEYDWLIFTSQNGVEFFFALLQQVKKPVKMPKIAVIGNKTKEALAAKGYAPDFIPDQFVAEAFAAQFLGHLAEDDKVLIVKGNLARSVIADEINQFGAYCEEFIAYDTIFPETSERVLIELLQNGSVDIITFTSSSTVQHFMEAVRRLGMQKEAGKKIVVCIGPITRKTAEDYGLEVAVCPDEEYTTHAMIESLIHYLQDKNEKEEIE